MRFVMYLSLLASAALLTLSYAQATPAPAQTAPAAAAKYTTADTDVGTLLDNQIDMARSMTLQSMQNYAPDKLTNETLAKVDAELAKVPVQK